MKEYSKEKTMQKPERKVQQLTLCGLFTALTAIGAFIQISIPVEPFPMHFTLQFFFSLLAGFVLGGRLGALSVGIYLLIGLCGVPVFASGGGPSYLLKPTFGFLLGFVFAAGVTGWLSEKFAPQKIWGYLFISTAGFAVMYLSGNLYFYFVSNYVIHVPVSWKLILINCFFLTAAGDYLLCILASITARRLLILKKKILSN